MQHYEKSLILLSSYPLFSHEKYVTLMLTHYTPIHRIYSLKTEEKRLEL